jgi:hypothetical protein
MALVPKKPSDLVPYDTRGLTRSHRRYMEMEYQERALRQEGDALLSQQEQRNLGRQARLIADELTELNADFQSKIDANDSPRLEEALEQLFAGTKALSFRTLGAGFGNG